MTTRGFLLSVMFTGVSIDGNNVELVFWESRQLMNYSLLLLHVETYHRCYRTAVQTMRV